MKVIADVSNDSLGRHLLDLALDLAWNPETAGLELVTDTNGNTYCDNVAWKISDDPRVASLVEASRVLRGESLRILSMQEVVTEIRRMRDDGILGPERVQTGNVVRLVR